MRGALPRQPPWRSLSRLPSRESSRLFLRSVGQVGNLRGDWQSPRVPIANRHAACQAAPQKNSASEAVRAVGAANDANPVAIVVPCHRVIGAGGKLVGYGGGLPLKRRLLSLERGGLFE